MPKSKIHIRRRATQKKAKAHRQRMLALASRRYGSRRRSSSSSRSGQYRKVPVTYVD